MHGVESVYIYGAESGEQTCASSRRKVWTGQVKAKPMNPTVMWCFPNIWTLVTYSEPPRNRSPLITKTPIRTNDFSHSLTHLVPSFAIVSSALQPSLLFGHRLCVAFLPPTTLLIPFIYGFNQRFSTPQDPSVAPQHSINPRAPTSRLQVPQHYFLVLSTTWTTMLVNSSVPSTYTRVRIYGVLAGDPLLPSSYFPTHDPGAQ